MNRITKFVNTVDEWLAPLGELVKDETFKGEFLKELAAKEPAPAATTQKLNFILACLNEIRKKLGLDKSDIPNVSNIAALAMTLVELYKVWEAIDEMLKTLDYSGPNGQAPTSDEEEIAISNARRAIAKFLTQTLFWKKAPQVAAVFDAVGLFTDESNEILRVLDLLLYPYLRMAKKLGVDPDSLRPIGDTKEDGPLRSTRGMFLSLSILSMIFLEDRLSGIGRFLFNMGYELPPEKDIFPNASRIAARVLQMQFQPAYGQNEAEEFEGPNTTDCVFSFATIPVPSPGAQPGAEPEGYQFMLSMDLNPGDFGTEAGGFKITFPSHFVQSFIWGHNTTFHGINPNLLTQDPLIQIQWIGKKETGQGKQEEPNTANGGDVFLKLQPKTKIVDGQENMDIEFILEFHDFSVSLSGEGRDGFLQKILPANSAAKINISLSIVYSPLLNKWSLEGLGGNNGLLFLFNVGKTIFGHLEIPTLYAGLKPLLDEDKKIRGAALEASAMLKFELGPFQMTVDRLGLLLPLNFPKKADGNFGMADLDCSLKPPTAIGFVVNASVVKGGGILSVDPENHQYYGAGELTIELKKFTLSLKVIAIILTRMPDGTEGFSFLLMASVEFNPGISTAFGFKLKGVGVMVAVHRSMNLEAFQNAIRDDRIDLILFPDNPVGNAPTIVKAMNSLFPPAQDRYVFAVMARIGWGTGKIVDLKLGLLIEVPSPVKIAIAGILKVQVEKSGRQIVKLQVNFLIALDLGKQIFSIDAAIYDSKFIIFDIRGELYIRYRWGDAPAFLVSVGGWHPDFQVPEGLNLPAKPQRVTIPLINGEHTKLILSCYLAFTSNTFQVGCKIELKVKVSKFRLESELSIDALFHFEPFYFVVDFEGKLRIYWGDSRLAGVSVKGKFSGTNPWRIRGTASFEIWIWDYDVDFDESSGDELTEITQDAEVFPLIEKAISDTGNWQAVLPEGKSSHIVLRDSSQDSTGTDQEPPTPIILADPLSRIEVMQAVAPLGISIDKLGSQKVKGPRKFDITAQNEANSDFTGADLDDHFAPAMFIEMEDAEKLSRKSFERMKAGVSLADTGSLSCGAAQIAECVFDSLYNDPLAPADKPGTDLSKDNFQRWLHNNSAAKSAEGRKRASRNEIDSRKKPGKPDLFLLSDAITGERIAEVPGQKSMTGAYDEVSKLKKINPLRKLNVVRESDFMS